VGRNIASDRLASAPSDIREENEQVRYAAVLIAVVIAGAPVARAEPAPAAPTVDAASRCREAIETAVTRYVRARAGALARCHDDTEAGRLRPRDCVTEPRTAARLARAETKAVAHMRRACTEEAVLAQPPRGLGAAACGGSDGTCEFHFASLDDGVRGNDNDYLDCVLCLSDRSVDERIDARYAGVATEEPPRSETTCRARLGQAAIVLTDRRLALLRRCHGDECSPKRIRARIAADAAKLRARLLAPCEAATALRHRDAAPNMPAA
jgi:hypothetical protein